MSAPVALRFWLLLLLLAGIWSSSFLLIKLAVDSLPPLTLTTARMALGALLLAGVAWARRERWPREPHVWLAFLVLGVLANVAPYSLIQWGEITVDSAQAAILMGIMPVSTAVMAHFLTDDPLTSTRIAGVLLAFGGLVALVGGDALAGLGGHVLAECAILGAALCYAMATVFVRRYVRTSGSLMGLGSLCVGIACVLPVALVVEQPWTLSPSATSIAALIMLGVFSTGFATLLYFHIIAHVGATFFSQVNYLVPVMGVGWGWLVLAEQPGPNAWLALAAILAGVALVNKPTRRR